MKYITKNHIVCDVVNDFYDFHQYLFEHDFFNNSYKSVFELSIQNEQEKLNLYADCQSQLSTLNEYFLYTNENFSNTHLHDLQKKYRSILKLMILIKPYVKESDLESLLSLQYQYTRIFENVRPYLIKTVTKNIINENFHKKLVLLNQEYETKANFYTATESKLKKHYTKETWFIVGLKFVDGTVYDYEPDLKKGIPLVRKIFEKEFLSLDEKTISDLINKYKHNVNGSLGYGSRNLFENTPKHENQWHQICNYHKEQGGEIDRRFIEQFSKIYIYSTLIE